MSAFRLSEISLCRLAALKYALELINEKEDELGIPRAGPNAIPSFDADAIARFVISKGEQIQQAYASQGGRPMIAPADPKSRRRLSLKKWRYFNHAKQRNYARAYYKTNRDRLIARLRAWRARTGYDLSWYQKNKARVKAGRRRTYNPAKAAAYYQANAERIKALRRASYHRERAEIAG